MKPTLRFPNSTDAPDAEPKVRTYSEPQKFVSRIWRIFDEVGAERPAAALLMRLRRRLFADDSEAMTAAVDDCADRGQLNVSVPYFAAVLVARSERGEFNQVAPPVAALPRAEGELSPNGRYRWVDGDWSPASGELN